MSKLFLFVVVIGCVGCTVSKEKVVIKNSQKKSGCDEARKHL